MQYIKAIIFITITLVLGSCDLVVIAVVETTKAYTASQEEAEAEAAAEEAARKQAEQEKAELERSLAELNSDGSSKQQPLENVLIVEKWEGPWKRLNDDLIHDVENPMFPLLQEPGAPLHKLPATPGGNQVDWELARLSALINPRETLDPDYETNVLKLDIYLDVNGSLPVVRFPHSTHTEWVGCNSCHDKLFAMKIGETKFTMIDILNERACGACHGKVAFPLNDCFRCHNTSHDRYRKIKALNKKKAEENDAG